MKRGKEKECTSFSQFRFVGRKRNSGLSVDALGKEDDGFERSSYSYSKKRKREKVEHVHVFQPKKMERKVILLQ